MSPWICCSWRRLLKASPPVSSCLFLSLPVSSCLLLSPPASSCLLLSPPVSSCLLLPPGVSACHPCHRTSLRVHGALMLCVCVCVAARICTRAGHTQRPSCAALMEPLDRRTTDRRSVPTRVVMTTCPRASAGGMNSVTDSGTPTLSSTSSQRSHDRIHRNVASRASFGTAGSNRSSRIVAMSWYPF